MPYRAALITALILDRPMCSDCIAEKAGLSAADLDATLTTIRAVLQLHSGMDRCRTCGLTTTVLSVDRPI